MQTGDQQGYKQAGVAMTCRSFEEYLQMFSLKEADLKKAKIVDIAAGASSFTDDARAKGYDVSAYDPLYSLSAEAMRQHGEKDLTEASEKIDQLAHLFKWDYYGSYEQYLQLREDSLARFLKSYSILKGHGVYQAAKLPQLPARDAAYTLVLCSHFLLLYHEQFDLSFHKAAIMELLRICKPGGEIRIYPMLTLKWEPYPYMDELLTFIRNEGAEAVCLSSQLPFIPNSTELLCIRK
jgi:SAM-dependent methyltransferase